MTPRPPLAVAVLILVCGLVPLGILVPYGWTGQWLKGGLLAVVQIVLAGLGLVGGVFLGMGIEGMVSDGPVRGSVLPVLTMPLGCMAAAYAFSAWCAFAAFREHRAALAAA